MRQPGLGGHCVQRLQPLKGQEDDRSDARVCVCLELEMGMG